MAEREQGIVGRRQLILAGAGLLGPSAAGAGRPSDREVIFYTPHPDDETLSMSVLIANHARVGRKVHVVLLSDGRTSGALAAVNARLARQKLPALTLAQFGAGRVRELRAACARLGVAAGNVHVENVADTLTVANTQPVIRRYQARFPDAGHYTMSWTDPFGDHGNVGKALRQLQRADPTAFFDTRWVVYRIHWGEKAVRDLGPWWARPDAVVRSRILAAIAEYGVWNPAAGRYRIGFYSVISQFNALRADVRDLVHGP